MSYSGPFHRSQNIRWADADGPSDQFRSEQDVYKTNPGSVRIGLPYFHGHSYYDNRKVWGGAGHVEPPDCYQLGNSQNPIGYLYNDPNGLRVTARNRARSKFISELRQKQEASIGAALGEWSQSFSMIAARLKSLNDAYRALKHGRINDAARALSCPPPKHLGKGVKGQAKHAADLWLEWHFGWSPMLSDIYNAMDALSSPLPLIQHIKVASRSSRDLGLTETVNTGWLKSEISGSFNSVSRIQGYAKLVSPSVGLLDQLGLVNPVGVAWELVPFSFLVDHVIGIGDFIDSYTDTLGWELTDVVVTTFDYLRNGFLRSSRAVSTQYNWTYGDDVDADAFFIWRGRPGLSLPPYCVQFTNPFRDISVARAATYCSLLLQAMS